MGENTNQPQQRRARVREVSSRFMSPVSADPTPSRHGSRRHLDLDTLRCSSDHNSVGAEADENRIEDLIASRRQKHRPVNAKPLKENGGSSRPDTPMMTTSLDRTPSRSRLTQQCVSATAAAKLLKSSTSEANIRSSMPEADMLPTVSTRQVTEQNCNRVSSSPCSRSLILPLSSSEHSLFQSIKGSERSAYPFSKTITSLPPVPPCTTTTTAKPASELKKGKKDDVHSLRLLQSRYFQWRFANATAQASMEAQQRETEKTLCSLALQITKLCESVKSKRIELGVLQRRKDLSTILEAQIPYLDQWFSLQEEYSASLAEATQALLNASLRLPISANVTANKQEVEEALNSTMEVMEKIVFHVQQYMPKAEEIDLIISELARVFGGEKTLIAECGNLLSKRYTKQVEECSLRGHIIQLKQQP